MNVRSICLAVLSMGDATGYEIKKVTEGPLQQLFDASFGSIYAGLTRLTEDGLVTCAAQSQSGKPDKKVYSLTQAGRAALLDTLTPLPGPDRMRSEFLFTMLFAHLLSPTHISGVIEHRLEIYRNLLEALESGALAALLGDFGDPAATAFVSGYGAAMIRASLAYVEENRHLVESAALLGGGRLSVPVEKTPAVGDPS